MKLLLVHPFLALILNNLNIVDEHVKLEQLGYKYISESSFNESYMCASWKLYYSISRIMSFIISSKCILEC